MGIFVTGDGFVRLRLSETDEVMKALQAVDPSVAFSVPPVHHKGAAVPIPKTTPNQPEHVGEMLSLLLPQGDDTFVSVSLIDAATYELEINGHGRMRMEDEAMAALAPFVLMGQVDWQEHDFGRQYRDLFLNGLRRRVTASLVYEDPDWPLCPRCQAEGFEGLCDTCQLETADQVPDALVALRDRLSAPAEGEADEPR